MMVQTKVGVLVLSTLLDVSAYLDYLFAMNFSGLTLELSGVVLIILLWGPAYSAHDTFFSKLKS